MAVCWCASISPASIWGDCSLSNTLFRRDAGELQAYMVDAETSEQHEKLSDGQRAMDLGILEENVAGDLADLQMVVQLPPAVSAERDRRADPPALRSTVERDQPPAPHPASES